jgi:hypothetical protein
MNRNSKCPCNSGLKYKKCCLIKEQQEKQNLIIKERDELRRFLIEYRSRKAKKDENIASDNYDQLFGTHISSDMGLGVLGALLSLKGKKRKF